MGQWIQTSHFQLKFVWNWNIFFWSVVGHVTGFKQDVGRRDHQLFAASKVRLLRKALESRFCSSSPGPFHGSPTKGLLLSRRAKAADCGWGPNSPEDLKNFLLFRHGYKNVDIRRHFSIWEHGLSVNNSDSFTENTVLGAVRDVIELVTSFADMTDVLIIY